MTHRHGGLDFRYSPGLIQVHVHSCAFREAIRFMQVILLSFATLSIGYGEEIDVLKPTASQVSTTVGTDYMGQGYWQCCKGIDLAMFADLQPLCQSVEEQACIDVRVETDPRDRDGLRHDTGYFIGYQVATIGILYMMPESVSGWSDDQKSNYSMFVWWDNVSHPVWDEDDFFINYVTHPYWGAAYFVRARERGYSSKESFWYSVLLSSAYEFGAEALFEQPSIQDLIVTPVIGSMVGRYFMRVRDDIRERSDSHGYRTTKDKWVWALTDPLGALNRQVDKMFGREVRLHIHPYAQSYLPVGKSPVDNFRMDKDRVVGLQIYVQW